MTNRSLLDRVQEKRRNLGAADDRIVPSNTPAYYEHVHDFVPTTSARDAPRELFLIPASRTPLELDFTSSTKGQIQTPWVRVAQFQAAVSVYPIMRDGKAEAVECRLHMRPYHSKDSTSYNATAQLRLERCGEGVTCEAFSLDANADDTQGRSQDNLFFDRLVVIAGRGKQAGRHHTLIMPEKIYSSFEAGAWIGLKFSLEIRSTPVSLPCSEETITVQGKRRINSDNAPERETSAVQGKTKPLPWYHMPSSTISEHVTSVDLHIPPALLAVWSNAFARQLRNGIRNVKLDEGTTIDDFIDMLFVIAPVGKAINDRNYRPLLRLAEQLEMIELKAKVEQFLIEWNQHRIEFAELYKVSTDDHDLPILRSYLLDHWKVPRLMQEELLRTEFYAQLGMNAKNLVNQKFTESHHLLGLQKNHNHDITFLK